MKARYGLTLIFIAHDLAVVKNVSDRVAVMYLGKLCEVAPPDALYDRAGPPVHRRCWPAIPVPDPAVRGPRPTWRPRRRPAVAGRPAERLPLPHPLPAGRSSGAPRRSPRCGRWARTTSWPATSRWSTAVARRSPSHGRLSGIAVSAVVLRGRPSTGRAPGAVQAARAKTRTRPRPRDPQAQSDRRRCRWAISTTGGEVAVRRDRRGGGRTRGQLAVYAYFGDRDGLAAEVYVHILERLDRSAPRTPRSTRRLRHRWSGGCMTLPRPTGPHGGVVSDPGRQHPRVAPAAADRAGANHPAVSRRPAAHGRLAAAWRRRRPRPRAHLGGGVVGMLESATFLTGARPRYRHRPARSLLRLPLVRPVEPRPPRHRAAPARDVRRGPRERRRSARSYLPIAKPGVSRRRRRQQYHATIVR